MLIESPSIKKKCKIKKEKKKRKRRRRRKRFENKSDHFHVCRASFLSSIIFNFQRFTHSLKAYFKIHYSIDDCVSVCWSTFYGKEYHKNLYDISNILFGETKCLEMNRMKEKEKKMKENNNITIVTTYNSIPSYMHYANHHHHHHHTFCSFYYVLLSLNEH